MHPNILGKLAEAAYDTNDVISYCHQNSYELVQAFKGGSRNDTTFGYAVADHDAQRLFFVYRGTEPHNLRQWLVDLDAKKVDWPYGKVHRGFLRSVSYVWPVVKPHFEHYVSKKRYRLYLTGHSKGAAEATITASRCLLQPNLPVTGLATFGSPRVGTSKFARHLDYSLNGQAVRYTNNNDVVVRTPLDAAWLVKYVPFGKAFHEFLPIGFSHLRNHRHIDRNGSLSSLPPTLSGRFRLFIDRLRGRVLAGRDWYKDGIQDHNMSHYTSFLSRETYEIE